jgi:hypothetical protein
LIDLELLRDLPLRPPASHLDPLRSTHANVPRRASARVLRRCYNYPRSGTSEPQSSGTSASTPPSLSRKKNVLPLICDVRTGK